MDTQQSSPYLDLAEILGHERWQCSVPQGSEEEAQLWTTKYFLPVLNSLPPDLLGRLVFVDMLFSRVKDQTFFGGIAVAGDDKRKTYETVLDELLSEYITVGTHPDFQRGLTTPDRGGAREQWLFSEASNGSLAGQPSGDPEGGQSPRFLLSEVWIDAKDKIPALLEGVTPSQWRIEAAKKNLKQNWQCLVGKLARSDLQSVSGGRLGYVAGIPVTIPGGDQAAEGFHVASLFIGVDDTVDKVKQTIGAIALRLIPFALRTFALQKAEQVGTLKIAEVKAEIYRQIEPDIHKVIQHVSQLRNFMLRVESAITISNEDFLDHAPNLIRIFLSTDVESHYTFQMEDGVYKEIKGPTGEKTDRDKLERGWDQDSFKSAHKSCDTETWKPIGRFLNVYGKVQKVALLADFGVVTLGKGDDAIAIKLHGLLKSLTDRSMKSRDRLYEVQIAIAVAAAWRKKLVDGKAVGICHGSETTWVGFDPTTDNIQLVQFVKSLENELFACDDDSAAKIREDANTADVLGALMRLVATELVEGKLARDNVEATTVEIHKFDRFLEVFLQCTGRFADIRKTCRIRAESEQHGFQSCLKILCNAVGQDQPALAYSNELDELRKLANASATAQFVIGQPSESTEDTSLFLRFLKGQGTSEFKQ